MNTFLCAVAICAVPAGQERTRLEPASHPLDEVVSAALKSRGLRPADLCTDEVFVRRVYLDIIGALPEPREVRRFLRDRRPNKRAALIDALLAAPGYADYWSMKWCDLLRVKSEFPINLWPNAVQAYHRWIHDALRENRPYDRFARQLLTSSGSNFRDPPANFYRAIQSRSPQGIAAAVALTFMGVRLEKWPEARSSALASFFARIAYKATGEWKEEIVTLNPAPVSSREAVLPDGSRVLLRPNEDPRRVFADWLIRADNPWFARNIANRVWAWLLGRGVVHEPDDIRPDNPPAIPGLLAALERELVRVRYDLKKLYRFILTSRTYQQSSRPAFLRPDAAALFACYPVRRLDAEVLIDALCGLTGTREAYSSPTPEPFAFLPEGRRTILLADGSITSSFLEMFGRPARDTGLFCERNNQVTEAQRLHLLNSTHIRSKIERGWRLRSVINSAGGDPRVLTRWLYLLILSRYPTKEEIVAGEAHFKTRGLGGRQAADDLAWALINSKEFLYRH